MFASAYYGLLWVGEIASGAHPIRAMDVHVAENKRKLLFILRTSKTHWTDTGPQHVRISSTHRHESSNNCPYKILNDYVAVRPKNCLHPAEPFFIFTDHTPVTPNHLRKTLKLMLGLVGVNKDLYDTHSYRIGRCMDLYKMGFEDSTLAKIGRWKSNCVYKYLSH